MNGQLGATGHLERRLIRAPRTHRARGIRIPHLGRLLLTRDPGDAGLFASEYFMSHLRALHLGPDGALKEARDLGSGLVTNVGVLAMANDFAWAQNCQTLKLANWHASGVGVTAAAATDFKLQTVSSQGGQTPVAGSQSLQSAANVQALRTIATITYAGSEAVTEWGLFTDSTLSAATGSPATATGATSLTATGTPFAASSSSVQGQQQHIVVPGTTAVWGLITSNTTSALTIPAWYKQSDGTAGSTPGATEAFAIRPVIWDHKVFAAFNVNGGDSIQFSYTLQVNSGG